MRREFLLLQEMIDAAEEVRTFIGDFDVEEIRTDGLRRAAVLWGYTVLGEASSQLPADVKEQYPNIEWTELPRLRSGIGWVCRIRHGPRAEIGPDPIGPRLSWKGPTLR